MFIPDLHFGGTSGASLVEPWFTFWRDIVKQKLYPWRVQMSLIYHQCVSSDWRIENMGTVIISGALAARRAAERGPILP